MDGAAIVLADRQGVISYWSEEAGVLFGYGAGDAVGRTLDLLVPEPLREAHWTGFRRAMRRPRLKDLAADLPVLCADGEVRTFAGRLVVVMDPLGAALGAMAIFARGVTTGVRP